LILRNKIKKFYSTEKESTPFVDFKQPANSANVQAPGGLNLDELV
jgi:hypothetical protein